MNGGRGIARHLLDVALALLLAALALNLAWALVQPVLPVILVTAALYLAVRYFIRHSRSW